MLGISQSIIAQNAEQSNTPQISEDKLMKKIIIPILMILLIFVLFGCSSTESSQTMINNETESKNIVTTRKNRETNTTVETTTRSKTKITYTNKTLPSRETTEYNPPFASDELIKLVNDSYVDLTPELIDEFTNFYENRYEGQMPTVYCINNDSDNSVPGLYDIIVYGVFGGYLVFFLNSPAFGSANFCIDNYCFYNSSWFTLDAYKDENTYHIYNAYDSGLLTIEDISKIYNIHKKYEIDFFKAFNAEELYNLYESEHQAHNN